MKDNIQQKGKPFIADKTAKGDANGLGTDPAQYVKSFDAINRDEHYRFLFKNMLNGAVLCKVVFEKGRAVDFIYLDANEVLKNDLGLDDMIGKTTREIFPGIYQSDPDMFEALEDVALTGEPRKFELYLNALQNWFMMSVYSPEKGYLVIIFDVITERKLNEKKLKESEERYRLITDNIADVVLTVDASGIYTFISPSHKNIFGRGEDVLGTNAFKYIHPDDIENVQMQFQKAQKEKNVVRLEYRYLHPERGYIWIESEGRFFRLNLNDIGLCVARDITTRKLAENELRESEKRYRQLFQSMITGLALFEVIRDEKEDVIDFRFLKVNPAFEKMTGYAENQVVGEKVLELFADVGKEWVNLLSRIFKEDVSSPINYFWESLKKHFEISMFSPKLGHVAMILLDVTEKKLAEEKNRKLEEELQQSYKMEAVGVLAGGIAHDFNNILSSILGFCELAKIKHETGEKFDDELDEIYNGGLRARDLVKQILTFSHRAEIKKEPIDVIPIFEETIKFMRASLPATIQIKQEIFIDSCLIIADPTQIHQIIMNICTNAAHAMQDTGGELNTQLKYAEIIETEESNAAGLKKGCYLQIAISDTGHGINEENIKRIFDPFFTTRKQGEGTGLGLSVVHGIIKDMKGSVSVYSELKKGTTFKILLPVYDGDFVQSPYAPFTLKTGKGRILLVDDEVTIIDSTQKILEQLGYQVLSTNNPLEALEIFSEDPEKFDLVYTDLTMPGMTGLDLSEKILKINPAMPIILSTGFNLGITPQKLKKIGLREIVLKPVMINELSEAIFKALNS